MRERERGEPVNILAHPCVSIHQLYLGESKVILKRIIKRKSYLLVPTLWFGAMSMVSVAESWRTARPRSAIQQVPFFFTRMFFDFRSLWAMAGFPGEGLSRVRSNSDWVRNRWKAKLKLLYSADWIFKISSHQGLVFQKHFFKVWSESRALISLLKPRYIQTRICVLWRAPFNSKNSQFPRWEWRHIDNVPATCQRSTRHCRCILS